MIPYILHVTIIITACWLFYKLFLQQETFYRLNRWTLLTCLTVAFLLPLLPAPRQWSFYRDIAAAMPVLPQTMQQTPPLQQPPSQPLLPTPPMQQAALQPVSQTQPHQQPPFQPLSQKLPPQRSLSKTRIETHLRVPASLPTGSDHATAINSGITPAPVRSPAALTRHPSESSSPLLPRLFYILYMIYLSGVVILGISLLVQIVLLLIRAYTRPVVRDGSFRIVEMTGDHAPCSFGKNIFINPSLYDRDTYCQILLHEKIHAGNWHSLDILLAELGIVFQWFNPFVWLYRKEVENNLEFLTDQTVLSHPEVERSSYQLSLLKVSVPNMPLSITSNYNQSLLKRRIIMMNSKHSPLHTVWKYFFLLPLLAFLVCALNMPAAMAQSVTTTKTEPTKKTTPIQGSPATPTTVIHTDVVSDTTRTTEQESAVLGLGGAVVQTTTMTEKMPDQSSVVISQQYMNTAATSDARIDTGKHDHWTDHSSGAWFATTDKDRLCIELKGGDENHNWSNSTCIPKSEFSGLSSVGKVEFKLVREAGTMTFAGQFDGDQGFGHYSFHADESYTGYLHQKGIEADNNDLVAFFFVDVKKNYVDMLQSNGFPHLSKNNLIAMAAMHIDEAYIRFWKDNGYDDMTENNLIAAKSLGIDRSYLEKIRSAGYDHPPVNTLISFKSVGIDGAYVRRVSNAMGGKSTLPSSQEIISWKSLGIDSGYLAGLKAAGYTDLPSHEIISFRSLNVDGAYIESFNAIGYRNIPANELISMRSLNVTGAYVKGFLDLGYKDIRPQTLISLKSMGITADYLKGFHDIGYTDLPLEKLTSLKSMGITANYIKDFNSLGFKNIPVDQLNSLKAMGVTADYVKKMREKGFVSEDLEKYIRLKNSF